MKKVSAEDLVKAWEQSASKKEVAEKTGLGVPQIEARISKYRKELKRLGLTQPKKMPRGARIDYAGIAKIIKSLRG